MDEKKEDEILPKTFARILSFLNELTNNVLDPKIETTDVEISRFKLGYVSEIYRVDLTDLAISKFIDTQRQLPKTFVIKFFNIGASKEEIGFDVIDSQINALIIGRAGLGPRIYLIKPDAIVMQYCGGETLTGEHDADLRLREIIARKLARFHALDVPISRNNYREQLHALFHVWLTPKMLDQLTKGPLLAELRANSLTNFERNNFHAEADFVHRLIREHPITSANIVFSHCDFNHFNLLIADDIAVDDASDRITWSGTKTVQFIDFDFSSYFYRGADLGRYFVDCAQPEQFHDQDLIDDCEFLQFIEWYRDENRQIYGTTYTDKVENSAQQLLKEAKLFVLYACMVDCIFCIYVATEEVERDGDRAKMTQFLQHADQRFGGYLRFKERFLRDGSIPKS